MREKHTSLKCKRGNEIKNMMKNNLRPIVHDLKTGKEAYAQPGIKGKEYL